MWLKDNNKSHKKKNNRQSDFFLFSFIYMKNAFYA